MKEVKYRFSPNISPKTIKVIKAIDAGLNLLYKSRAKKVDVKEITVTQFAHIGDLLLTLPGLKRLKATSNLKVKLVVNSQNYAIAKRLNYIDEVYVADAPWFARGPQKSYWNFIKQLRKIKSDVIFDIRGDLRNNVFLKFFTRKKALVGYGVGGGGALLNEEFDFVYQGHASEFTTPIFKYLGLPESTNAAHWHEDDVPFDPLPDDNLPLNFVAVHLGAGAQSRRWTIPNFIQVIKGIALSTPVCVMGVAQDASPEELEIISSIPNVINLVGKYSLLQSISVVKRSTAFVGLESGFSHITGMLKKKAFVLFSGTSDINVWKPCSFYENQITLLQKRVPCDMGTGCGKFFCDDNICLKNIQPAEVIDLVNDYLRELRSESLIAS
ncbi:glycosyltransferase family 9 protein [Mucilaginibacter sp. JRF]|uniref:glycosyltransferase family 9 protein n=1 Tax=Mucilaginibacter sp. JRF TaxID=2780088 RepID=UPI00188057B5|nr:glycosyltransferase family 9 protein [Mucilaginibacter sp. JRF]MBE9585883.1 glycosyltransferase family 9 protein [Mucilaginibacter sp. JRF]